MARSLGFLTARTWLDEDGIHVWLAHDCDSGRVTTMLPWPVWSANGNDVAPSIHCRICELHYIAKLEAKGD